MIVSTLDHSLHHQINALRLFISSTSLRNITRQTCQFSSTTIGQIRSRRCLHKPSIARLSVRSFSTTSKLCKKKDKQIREEVTDQSAPTGNDDPADFDILEADIKASLEQLRMDLSKLRSGGRFNHELVEVLRVQTDKQSKSTVKLSDLAQVIPKGRTLQVMVGEKDYLKPVASAILASNLSLAPQPDATGRNPLLLEMSIPPPTTESRQVAVKEAIKAGEKAAVSVRNARSVQHKKHRAMQSLKHVRPDDLKKAAKQMEKIVENGHTEVKKVVDNAKKVLEAA